jgi:hypothetical protein
MFSWVFQAHLGLQEPDPRVLRLTSSTGVAPWSLRGSIELLTEPQYESSPMETRMIKQSRLALESWRHNETLQLWNPIESCGLILGGLLRSNGESQGSHRSSPSRHQLIQEQWGLSLEYWWFTLQLRRLPEKPWWVNLKVHCFVLKLESYISSRSCGDTKQWRLTLEAWGLNRLTL